MQVYIKVNNINQVGTLINSKRKKIFTNVVYKLASLSTIIRLFLLSTRDFNLNVSRISSLICSSQSYYSFTSVNSVLCQYYVKRKHYINESHVDVTVESIRQH